jgi:HTH-type transcriptional regulator / antitoxin HipB
MIWLIVPWEIGLFAFGTIVLNQTEKHRAVGFSQEIRTIAHNSLTPEDARHILSGIGAIVPKWRTMLNNARDAVAKEIGATIRQRRRELNTTQDDLAALAGVSTRFLGELERGKPTVRLDALLAVTWALGLRLTLA